MQFSIATLLTIAASVPFTSALTQSQRVQGYRLDWNYGHNSFLLYDVTMDDTTNSVYLANGYGLDSKARGWYGYSEKSKDGGVCQGVNLGRMPEGCVNINEVAKLVGRVKCVQSVIV
ncbi:hypothetical protein NEUTE1DRAFT_119607 [Neurospora tetrasperma FGSC 2508]|uniref:Uncharacterized protein n=1 Tax=Neurospora tetrasperma (strain FGSC 2508 / ATCC MYA-4615 / P0657) TaxID=510951 RepID=F8MCC9_NEUT8|nr:uncharacterized protein NEUTE1DRAFT_119607 [Neurospora tetrasperma FGSC 2508]EGO60430.1 hypothetical protein NEUTE1DRAFT_119607 [Neurospora tetrasperma FGSC 2508]EGZ75594.1 hypothetical protein NEUTE2DRAFT_156031 [Neurospora tetrasperma FGSC 2509]